MRIFMFIFLDKLEKKREKDKYKEKPPKEKDKICLLQ